MTGTTKDGSIFHVYFADHATLRGICRDGAAIDRDSGTWSVSDGGDSRLTPGNPAGL